MKSMPVRLCMFLLASCTRAPERTEAPDSSPRNANAAPSTATADIPKPPVERAQLKEPKGAIDPTSVEAAGQLVQQYGARIEKGRWAEAAALWADRGSAERFAADLRSQFGAVHLEIGNLGPAEGAAGSIYTEVPTIFYGDSVTGTPLRVSRTIVLRRVNDVPGATVEQRQWHIERIDARSG